MQRLFRERLSGGFVGDEPGRVARRFILRMKFQHRRMPGFINKLAELPQRRLQARHQILVMNLEILRVAAPSHSGFRVAQPGLNAGPQRPADIASDGEADDCDTMAHCRRVDWQLRRVLGNDARTIIETKFYREPFQKRLSDRERLRSAHLYQLFAYLKNLRIREPSRKLGGILLYAGVGKEVSASFHLQDIEVSVRTLDLMAPWSELRKSLLGLPLAHRAASS